MWGGWCGGKKLKKWEECDFSVSPVHEMDKCCKDHDRCVDSVRKGNGTYKACHEVMCDCLKNDVNPANFDRLGDEIVYGELLYYACDMQGPPFD